MEWSRFVYVMTFNKIRYYLSVNCVNNDKSINIMANNDTDNISKLTNIVNDGTTKITTIIYYIDIYMCVCVLTPNNG